MKENKRKQKAKKKRSFDIPFRLINKAEGKEGKGIKSNW